MATGGGQIRIFGDEDEGDSYSSKMKLIDVINGDEAEKMLKDKDKGKYYRYPSKEQYNDKRQYILRRFCGKTTDILIYATDILQLKGIDVIAVSEDSSVTGQGALSRVLLDAGDNKYRKEHSNLRSFFIDRSTSKVMLTSAGHKLPFHHVLHAVIRRTGEYEMMFQKILKETSWKAPTI